MTYIKDLDIDVVVNIDGVIAIVKSCIHGNHYYSDCGNIDDENILRDNDLTQQDIDNAITVSDGDIDMIPCCG